MAKERLFNLPETKGKFQIKGLVKGVEEDDFFVEKKTKTGKDFRKVKFGIEYDSECMLNVGVQGMPSESVYFSKKAEKQGEKPNTVKVPWKDRFTFNREGYRLIGNRVGLTKAVNQSGEIVNKNETLTNFDTCKNVQTNLKDKQSLFVKGNIEYSSFVDDKGNRKNAIKLVPSQLSLCGEVNFIDEDYKAQHDFSQVIVFMGIEQETMDDRLTGRYLVSAKIVTYSTIEDAEFVIERKELATLFKKKLNPYTAIKVHGHIVSVIQKSEVKENDGWGDPDPMTRVDNPYVRYFVITGADPKTIDTTVYTEEAMNDAIAKINRANKADVLYGDSTEDSGWTNVDGVEVPFDEDEEEAW